MKIRKYFCISLIIVSLFSCEDYLDPKLTSDYGDDITWGLPEYAKKVLLGAYSDITPNLCGYNGNNYLDAVTDNSLTTDGASLLYRYVFGSATADSDPIGIYNTAYNAIAIVNLFLEKGLSLDLKYYLTNPEYDRLTREYSKGECYFLRAWWQHELLKNYGGLSDSGEALGYVIVDRTFGDDEREMINSLPRNTFEECVQQIYNDLDTAFIYLPLEYNSDPNAEPNHPAGQSNYQRASGRAALALKSRVALLAASPAYQSAGTSEEAVRQKWLNAAVTAQEALTKGNMGELNNMIPLNNDLLVGDVINNWPKTANFHSEMLFIRTANNRNSEQHHYPAMWFGNAKCNPSQNLVNAYPMANGYPITHPNSEYDSQNPYSGRDGRFTRQINYNGGLFCEIPTERTMEIWSSADDRSIGRDAPGYDYRNTWTGYYLRKGLSNKPNRNYNPDNPGATQNDFKCNPLLRRCEVWMNLAEALNEYAGADGTAPGVDAANTPIAIIKQLRSLYGTGNAYVDEVAAEGKEAFRELILNERRLEFAFENMRLWDIRRWLMPQLNEPVLGIKVYAEYIGMDTNGNRKYNYIYFGTSPGVDDIVVQTRNLGNPKYYTSPIPYNEMMKNPNLVQNAGW